MQQERLTVGQISDLLGEPPAAGCRSKSYVKLHPKTAQRGVFLPALTASTSFHEVLQEARWFKRKIEELN